MTIKADKLLRELKTAGIETDFCNTNGKVLALDGITQIQDQPAVAAVIAAHNPNPTAAEIAAADNKEAAPGNLKKVMELNNLIPNQAAEWLERQVHAGKKKSEILTEINNASTVAELHQPVSELAEMLYQSTEANKKIVRLLVAVKDLYL
jgi:hypothetical protein